MLIALQAYWADTKQRGSGFITTTFFVVLHVKTKHLITVVTLPGFLMEECYSSVDFGEHKGLRSRESIIRCRMSTGSQAKAINNN